MIRLVLALAFVMGSFPRVAPAQNDRSENPVGAGVNVIPNSVYIDLLTDAERMAYERLLAIDDEQLDALLASDGPWEIGLGIHVVDVRGDLHRLLELAPLLEDDRPTVPFMYYKQMSRREGSGEYLTVASTVGGSVESKFKTWFKASINVLPEETKVVLREIYGPSMGGHDAMGRVEKIFGDVEDPELLLQPWLHRLVRTGGDGTKLDAVKERVRQLPPELRWAVLVESSRYSENERLAEIRNLPQDLLQAPSDQLSVPTDPTLPEMAIEDLRRKFINLRAMAMDSQPNP